MKERNLEHTIISITDLIKSGSLFALKNKKHLNELVTNLTVLKDDFIELLLLSQEFFKKSSLKVELDQVGNLSFKKGDHLLSQIKINFKKNITPKIDLISSAHFVPKFEENELAHVKRKLSSGLKNFYYNASKSWDLIEKISGKKSAEFIGVKRIRNHFFEHYKGDNYSFGITNESGIFVKAGESLFGKSDSGLIKNLDEFVKKAMTRIVQWI